MPLPSSRSAPTAAADPGRLRQIKLHEMAVAYGQILRERARRIAAEQGGRERFPPPAAGGAEGPDAHERRLAGILLDIMAEQCGGSASPFAGAVRGAFGGDSSGAGSGMEAAFSKVPASVGGIEELMPLVDLRAAEAVCWELLTEFFRWDGRRLVITAKRIADARAVVDRSAAALRSGAAPPESRETVKAAIKLVLTVRFLRGEPAPGEVARLKELYASLGGFPVPAGGRRSAGAGRALPGPAGEDRGELAGEIETFCRTLEVLREAADAVDE